MIQPYPRVGLMNHTTIIFVVMLSLATPPLSAASVDPEPDLLKKGNQLAFIGDSITHGFSDPSVKKGDHYHGLLQLYFATHHPERDLWTVNLGRAGDNLGGLINERMTDRDVFLHLPGVVKESDVAFIMYGMNDAGSLGYLNPDKPPSDRSKQGRRKDFESRLDSAVTALIEKGVQVVVLSPTLYDETVQKNVRPAIGFNTELASYTQIAREVAERNNAMFIDVHTLMTAKNHEIQADNPKFSYTRDRVHPHSGGAAITLYAILKSLKLESSVFQVEIDAGDTPSNVGTAEHVAITGLKKMGPSLVWTSTEDNLPLPINTKEYPYDNSFEHVPFTEEFNRQNLTVSGLAAGDYVLEINDTPVAEFTAKELGDGVDLSSIATTPQYQAAWALREILFRKQTLEIIKRDINSLRLNIEGHFKGSDPVAHAELTEHNWDEPDVEMILDHMERALVEKQEARRNTSGFLGHVAGQTRRNLDKVREYNRELAEIRAQIENLPESRTYTYRLTPKR